MIDCDARPTEPLAGVRVVDLTRILAGPYATMILGDLGADVVKVEIPGRGDDTRHWGPPRAAGSATYYTAVNRNKRSVAIDLKHPAGRTVMQRLLTDADLLVSNFSPGVMERLGLGQAELADAFPRLICCTISGHAPDDPRASRPSFDLVIQAETGLMDLTGRPDGPPTKVGISIADELAGLYLVPGVVAALYHRERTGEASAVNVALNEAMLAAFTYQSEQYLAGGAAPQRMGNTHPSLVPYRAYRAADTDLVVGVANENQWVSFCAAIDLEHLLEDPRFANNTERVRHRAALEPELEARLRELPAAEWIARLGAANVPCGPVQTAAAAIDAEIELDTGFVAVGPGGWRTVGSPISIDGARPVVRRPAPGLGEHTDEVLTALGFDQTEISAMRVDGVVA